MDDCRQCRRSNLYKHVRPPDSEIRFELFDFDVFSDWTKSAFSLTQLSCEPSAFCFSTFRWFSSTFPSCFSSRFLSPSSRTDTDKLSARSKRRPSARRSASSSARVDLSLLSVELKFRSIRRCFFADERWVRPYP